MCVQYQTPQHASVSIYMTRRSFSTITGKVLGVPNLQYRLSTMLLNTI
jgi:hypothetical protein